MDEKILKELKEHLEKVRRGTLTCKGIYIHEIDEKSETITFQVENYVNLDPNISVNFKIPFRNFIDFISPEP